MFEFHLAAGDGGGYYPDSGPGPKSLMFGNTEHGFFGEVEASELFTATEINAVAGLTVGTELADPGVWLKFFHKGKVLYYAKKQHRHSVSWNDIYNAGVMYGVRGPGRCPVGSGVDQLKLLHKHGNSFILRTPSIGVDPSPNAIDPYDPILLDSEWYTTIAPLANYRSNNDPYAGIRWPSYSRSELFSVTLDFTQNTRDGTPTRNMVASSTAALISGDNLKTNVSTSLAWRPVLELLVDPEFVIAPDELTYRTQGLKEPYFVETDTSQVLRPVRYADHTLIQPLAPYISEVTYD